MSPVHRASVKIGRPFKGRYRGLAFRRQGRFSGLLTFGFSHLGRQRLGT